MRRVSGSSRVRGSARGYRALGFFYRLLGYGFVSFIARAIVFYYFLFHPSLVAEAMRFHAALDPEAGPRRRWIAAWRRFRSFSTVFLDRFLVENGREDRFRLEHDGLEMLTEAVSAGRPLILWMSHFGNWEVAVHCLRRFDVPITMAVGRREGERIEVAQKEMLERRGVKMVYVEAGEELGAVELVRAIRRGGIVAVSGDRLFDERQRSVEVDFLNRRCRVPRGPYVLAGLTGAPLVKIFGIRLGHLRYRFVALPGRSVDLSERERREELIEEAARDCFSGLEEMVRAHPEQWYNFYRYWSD